MLTIPYVQLPQGSAPGQSDIENVEPDERLKFEYC